MTDDSPTSKILDKLDDISKEIKVLRHDLGKTKTDVSLMNLRFHSLEDGNKALQTDTSDIKSDLRRLEVLHEETDGVIQQIAEDVSPIMEGVVEQREKIAEHDDTLTEHDRRINFLEKTA